MSNPNRSISIQIFYLPFPNVHNFNPYNSLIPTNSSSMLSITRDNTRQSPTIYLLYRDFWGEIDDISKTIKDSLLSEFHINEYWLIEDRGDNSNKRGKAVEKVIWTQELGLTSYYLKNGAYYKLKL